MANVYHVSPMGCDRNPGSEQMPLRTINHAARLANPGDRVVVHAGEYREYVDPRTGGLGEYSRIVYEAAPGEHVVIKGSEIVTDWVQEAPCVWKKVLPNAMFGDWNPFAEPVAGDWVIRPNDWQLHTADVYLNGVSLYEARTLEDLYKAEKRESGHQVPWNTRVEKVLNPQESRYQWYAEVGAETTTVWCNFQNADPNQALVEINVRPSCFYPSRMGVNYVTVRGFEMCHTATPWAPPTANQPGLLGPHWAKGWVIENNHIHHAKCSGISLGKFDSISHNLYSRFGRKPGYQYQLEAVFEGLRRGWNKDNVGGHIVRNNVIHDCGQTGVVGHMGCAFSRVEHNHIYNIGVKREWFGYEIAGIKFHAAIDVVIANNNIHHCELGTWLDWEAQGTRVTRNLYHHNDRDLMIEVTHGPCLVDNNIFASEYAMDNTAQGSAFLYNLISGMIRHDTALNRATPYHMPHSTTVMGMGVTFGGDDRVHGNLFTGQYEAGTRKDMFTGTAGFDRFTLPEEYQQLLEAEGNTDEAKYLKVAQPVWCSGNAYAGLAKIFRGEQDAPYCEEAIQARVVEKDGVYSLEIDVPETVAAYQPNLVTAAQLPAPRMTEELYENPDGSEPDTALDILGQARTLQAVPGPLAQLKPGKQSIVIWQ